MKGDVVPEGGILVIPRQTVKECITRLGKEITEYYRALGTDHLYVIAVLKGSFIFLADLIRRIDHPIMVDFLGISGYGEMKAREGAGSVRFTKDISLDVYQQDVLLVEDIVDTGLTLSFIIRMLKERRPRSIEICALLDRKRRRIIDTPLRFVGFEVGDEFLVGYGLDRDHLYRNLPDIYRLA